MEGEGKVLRQVGGRGYFAIVRVLYAERWEHGQRIRVAQGAADAYATEAEWPAAAAVGAHLALTMAGVRGCVTILWVRGMVCDTTPMLVAIGVPMPKPVADSLQVLETTSNLASPNELPGLLE
jgi:hypothetical protein